MNVMTKDSDKMNDTQIVLCYSQITKKKVVEQFEDDGSQRSFRLQVGDDEVVVTDVVPIQRKVLKHKACRIYVETFKAEIHKAMDMHKLSQQSPPTGLDFVQYSKSTILRNVSLHLNDPAFFEQQHSVVAFDSEGQPPTIVQFATGTRHVYIFYVDQFKDQIRKVLSDTSVLKILCDKRAEERHFGEIANVHDIQANEKKSLVRLINETFNVELYKDKRIHFNQWRLPLTRQQVDYAAADVKWMFMLYDHHTV